MTALAAPPRVLGKLERLCRERHARDLALAYPKGLPKDMRRTQHPRGLWFDPEEANRHCQFIERFCRHSKGEWAGTLIQLEDWQRDNLRAMFGWQRPDGTRRFRIAYWEVPRKNAKSTTAAGVGLDLLGPDGEPGAEVYSSATKQDQAKIVHDAAVAMVKASPDLREVFALRRNNIFCAELGSKFAPLGADSNTLDGLNPHGNIVDELHAHKDRGVWDVLDTAMGARRQPLTFAITTAGIYEPESIGWQIHDHAVKVLEGVIEDDAFFAYIAAADPGDDWTAPETWAKANPNLGVSVKESYLAAQCEKAKQQPSFQNTFLRLHLNIWTQQRDRWIPIEKWNACDDTPIDLAAFAGRRCFAGLDLASKLDLTALGLIFPPLAPEDLWTAVCRFWCPEETIQERSRRDRVPYDAWVRDGWITATPGNVTDYDFIEAEVATLHQTLGIEQLAYDPWNATQVATHLQGILGTTPKGEARVVEVRQGYRSLSEPSKEFEKLVVSRRLAHGGNPVLRWMVANVAKREDPNQNIAPDKAASSDKIDGVVALIMALSRAIVEPAPAPPPTVWTVG